MAQSPTYNIITESKLVSLNSQYAILNNGSYLSDVDFTTNKLLIPDDSIINVELSLIHAEIPVSFYNINYTCNLFRIQSGAGTTYTYTIPVGNYNATSLISQLTTLTAVNFTGLTITFNKITGKLLFGWTSAFTIYNNFTNSISTLLGFNNDTTNTSVANSLTPPNPINLLGIKRISIVSNDIATFNYTSIGNINLLASIPVDQPSYSLIVYENKNQLKHHLHLQEINRFSIQLLDENFNAINFNNIHWTMLFSIYITRRVPILSIEQSLGVPSREIPSLNKTENKKDIPPTLGNAASGLGDSETELLMS